jgi:hypothetical protein
MNEEIKNQYLIDYYHKYELFMLKNYPQLYTKFYFNISPPKDIGICVSIEKGEKSEDDYNEILKITEEFCAKYPTLTDMPKEF